MSRHPLPRPPRHAVLLLLLAALLLSPPRGARADIYQWVDEQGVHHFTDDPGAIPEERRTGTKVFLKEGPRKAEPPPTAPRGGAPPPSPSSAPPPDDAAGPGTGGAGTDALRLEADQLRAKISAKESLVRQVEERRSLAVGHPGSRIVDPEDMELYRKYAEELPSDRARLRSLEERLR